MATMAPMHTQKTNGHPDHCECAGGLLPLEPVALVVGLIGTGGHLRAEEWK